MSSFQILEFLRIFFRLLVVGWIILYSYILRVRISVIEDAIFILITDVPFGWCNDRNTCVSTLFTRLPLIHQKTIATESVPFRSQEDFEPCSSLNLTQSINKGDSIACTIWVVKWISISIWSPKHGKPNLKTTKWVRFRTAEQGSKEKSKTITRR